MQVLRRENPLFKRGLTFAQRVNYMSSIVTYFEAFQRLAYTLAPSIVLLTAVLPIHSAILPCFALHPLLCIRDARHHCAEQRPLQTN
jgi:cellulose synthase (UDP-forming)